MNLTVVGRGFAPVKGTAHQPYDALVLDQHGAVGDRELCLVDVAARKVLRTVQHPRLLTVRATRHADGLDLAMPDGGTVSGALEPTGETVTCDYWGRSVDLEILDGPHAEACSDLLGRPVRLARAPRAGIIFAGPGVSLLGTASLRDLAERLGVRAVDPARFRATLVVETQVPYEEEAWLGRELTLGTATVRIGLPVPRCAVIDHDPTTGERDARVLRTLAGYRPRNDAGEPLFGVLAGVAAAGRV